MVITLFLIYRTGHYQMQRPFSKTHCQTLKTLIHANPRMMMRPSSQKSMTGVKFILIASNQSLIKATAHHHMLFQHWVPLLIVFALFLRNQLNFHLKKLLTVIREITIVMVDMLQEFIVGEKERDLFLNNATHTMEMLESVMMII